MIKIKKAYYHTIGTNFDTYIKRFTNKYIEFSKFNIEKVSEKQFVIIYKNKNIDEFNSKSTLNQYINSMIAIGFIKESIGEYIICDTKNAERTWECIFEKHSDKTINIIRQSRILSLLTRINYINKENFDSFEFKGKRGKPKLENFKKEMCILDKTILKDLNLLSKILKEVIKYEFEI